MSKDPMVSNALVSKITNVVFKKKYFLIPTLFLIYMMISMMQFVSHIYLYDAHAFFKQR